MDQPVLEVKGHIVAVCSVNMRLSYRRGKSVRLSGVHTAGALCVKA